MEIDALVGAHVDLSKRIDGMNDTLQRKSLLPTMPIHKPQFNIGISTGAPSMLIVCTDNPSPGRVWTILRASLFGSDGHTALAGVVADVYAGPGQEADPTAQFLTGVAVPSINIIGHRNVWVHQNENIYALVYGVAALQAVTFVCHIEDWPVDSVESLRI